MKSFVDDAAPGRIRRLTLTTIPPAFAAMVIWYCLWTYNSGSYAGTWQFSGWALPVIALPAVFLAVFVWYWRWPALQRASATMSMAFSAAIITGTVLELVHRLGTTPPAPELPAWHAASTAAAALLAGLIGWLLVSPLPPGPESTTRPPKAAPALPLGSRQKAMFTTATWSRWQLTVGMGMLAVAMALFASESGATTVGIFAVIGLLEVVQAYGRLHIDGAGVSLTLGGLIRLPLPAGQIHNAYALEHPPPARRFPPSGGSAGWGLVTGGGPVLVLRLTDGREFVYSTRSALEAAALVNGCLTRERADVDQG